jgi:hypothetical protein
VTTAAEKTVDGVTEGGLRSETGEKGLLQQHGDGLASVTSSGIPHGDLSGVSRATSVPLKGPKTVKMARPPHNSGLIRFFEFSICPR